MVKDTQTLCLACGVEIHHSMELCFTCSTSAKRYKMSAEEYAEWLEKEAETLSRMEKFLEEVDPEFMEAYKASNYPLFAKYAILKDRARELGFK